ncbi:MAG: ATP-sensitive inward rectifier potassium channel 10, partial [Deltaproteobacteria bacterium]|nr:ATP-sensitive inward rectifier potassium channel 10 [Deltaproteobacteria bacterium]
NDIYHRTLKASWSTFILAFILIYLSFILLFAFLYSLKPESLSGVSGKSFLEFFSFSLQTSSTIGYGRMAPILPYSHLLVSVQSTLSLLLLAIYTGLVFAKFSRPQAKVLFTDKVILTQYHGQKALMLRIANARSNQILEGRARLTILKNDLSPEGHQIRRLHDLKLLRDSTPIFGLTWTLIHPIDQESPLAKLSLEDIQADNIDLFVTFRGIDDTFVQTVLEKRHYRPHHIIQAKKFVDMLKIEGDQLEIDLNKFNQIEEV